jgi:hypothetical protein
MPSLGDIVGAVTSSFMMGVMLFMIYVIFEVLNEGEDK